MPVLIARDGWGELRGTSGACRQLVDVLAMALGLSVRVQRVKRPTRVLKPGGRIL